MSEKYEIPVGFSKLGPRSQRLRPPSCPPPQERAAEECSPCGRDVDGDDCGQRMLTASVLAAETLAALNEARLVLFALDRRLDPCIQTENCAQACDETRAPSLMEELSECRALARGVSALAQRVADKIGECGG